MKKGIAYRFGNLIDSFISVFSPMSASKRRAWRNNFYIGYEAASPTRKDDVFPWDGKAEAMNKAARQTLRARARDLERNSEVASGVLEALDRNVIGTGISMQAQTKSKAFNERIEKLWNSWCHAENCDITETQSLNDLVRMIFRRQWVDGGVLVIYSIDKNKRIPLQIQVREVDDLATGSYPYTSGNILSEGVEMNKVGKPIAYYLTTTDANGFETMVPERIPAERVSFLWDRTRPSQFREVSRLAKAITRIKDLDDYNQAVAFQQKTQACTSVYIETDNTNELPGRPSNNGDFNRLEQISAGSVNYLKPGEKVATLIPNGQAAEVANYMVTQLRLVAAGQGLSLEGTTRDVERVNYSSARQNLIEDNKTYKRLRDDLIEHLMRPMYKKFVKACYLAGLLDRCGFDIADEDFYEATWLAEGMPWIDPKKEAEADNIALQNNTTTLQAVCARNGLDWLDVLDQKEREQKEITKRGLKSTLVINQTTQKGEGDDTNAE